MSNDLSSDRYNELQQTINERYWGDVKNGKIKHVTSKKPKAEKVFSIRLVDRDGEKVAVVNMME